MKRRTCLFLRKELILLIALVCSCFSLTAQEFMLQGNVKSSVGEPLVGVSVIPKESGSPVISDLDGNFWISVQVGDIIQFSYVGFASKEVRVRNSAMLWVILEDEDSLDSNVYPVGYSNRRKSDVASPIVGITPDGVNQGWVTTVQEMLMGRVAGLDVTSDGGAPGSGAIMRIRQGASLAANSEPLIVVDGFPMDHSGITGLANPLSIINPNDIESFTILKDVTASAIYGQRGANGVIQITTKKGKLGEKPTVSYHGNMSVSTLSRSKTDVMTGDEIRSMATNRYNGNNSVLSHLGNQNTDWQDEIFRQAVSTDHHVSVSGGLNFMPYRVSMAYTNQNGILKGSGFDRFTTTVQLNPTLFNEHLKFNIQAKYMHAKTSFGNQEAIKSSVYMDPTQPVYNQDGTFWQWMGDNGEVNPYATPNPLSLVEETQERGLVNNFMGQIGAEYRFHFLPSLKIVANMGIDKSTGKRMYDSVSPFYGYTKEDGAYYYNERSEKTNSLFNAYLQWNHNHRRNRLEMMAGYEWQHFDETDEYAGRDVTAGQYHFSNIYQTALFGRIHYTHRNKYIVSLEARTGPAYSHDWEDNTFGAFTLGWKINEEVFLRNSRTVSNLKLRGSVGTAGQSDVNSLRNLPVSASNKQTIANNNMYYLGNQGYGLLPPSYNPVNRYNGYYGYNSYYNYYGYGYYGNYELNRNIPERTFTVNGGIDFGFWNNRLAGSVDYYYSTTFDLWGKSRRHDSLWSSNYSHYYYYNYYDDWERMGFDVSLAIQPIVTQNFRWDIGFNFNIAFAEHAYDDGGYWRDGNSAPVSIGNGEYTQRSDDSPHTFYLYEWYDPQSEYNYRTWYGKRASPKMIMALNTTFRYKDFDLSMMFRAQQDTYAYSEVLADQIYNGYMDVWNNNGYFTNRTREVLNKRSYPDTHYLMNAFAEDNSFVKCDYITVGYSLPTIADVITGGRVYATVQNPFVITNYKGRDPEIGYMTDSYTGLRSPGMDTGRLYPRPVSVVVGLTLNF